MFMSSMGQFESSMTRVLEPVCEVPELVEDDVVEPVGDDELLDDEMLPDWVVELLDDDDDELELTVDDEDDEEVTDEEIKEEDVEDGEDEDNDVVVLPVLFT
jgi:hypothetical protein